MEIHHPLLVRFPINSQASSDCNADQFRKQKQNNLLPDLKTIRIYSQNIYMGLFELCLEDEEARSEQII